MLTDSQYGPLPVRSGIDSMASRERRQALIAVDNGCSILNSPESAPIMSKLMSKCAWSGSTALNPGCHLSTIGLVASNMQEYTLI